MGSHSTLSKVSVVVGHDWAAVSTPPAARTSASGAHVSQLLDLKFITWLGLGAGAGVGAGAGAGWELGWGLGSG